jgi:hypothetical protein
MPATMPPKDALQRLLDGLQMFIREHLALARAEMKADVRAMGRDVAIGAAGVPALAAGYLLLMFAVAYLLAMVLPTWAAFGIVAVINVGAGAVLTGAGIRRVTRDRVELPVTARELQRDREWLGALKNNSRGREAALAPVRPSEAQPVARVTPQEAQDA